MSYASPPSAAPGTHPRVIVYVLPPYGTRPYMPEAWSAQTMPATQVVVLSAPDVHHVLKHSHGRGKLIQTLRMRALSHQQEVERRGVPAILCDDLGVEYAAGHANTVCILVRGVAGAPPPTFVQTCLSALHRHHRPYAVCPIAEGEKHYTVNPTSTVAMVFSLYHLPAPLLLGEVYPATFPLGEVAAYLQKYNLPTTAQAYWQVQGALVDRAIYTACAAAGNPVQHIQVSHWQYDPSHTSDSSHTSVLTTYAAQATSVTSTTHRIEDRIENYGTLMQDMLPSSWAVLTGAASGDTPPCVPGDQSCTEAAGDAAEWERWSMAAGLGTVLAACGLAAVCLGTTSS